LAFRHAPEGVDLWAKYLVDRFKDSVPKAMKKLQKEVYTQEDARKGRDVRAYVAMVMRHAKAAEMEKPHQQLSLVYNNLDPELRCQVTARDERTVASEWLKALATKQEAWQDMLNARRSRYAPTRAPPRFEYRGTDTKAYPRYGDRQGSSSGFRPFQPKQWQHRPQLQPREGADYKQNNNPRPLPPPKPRHLITAAYGEEKENKVCFDDEPSRRDYDGQRFRRYRRSDRANLASDFVDVPEEYRSEYEKELEESGYVAAEEFAYPNFPEDNDAQPRDEFYLAVSDKIKSRTCRKCDEVFPSRS
jgi:hypothetical protein